MILCKLHDPWSVHPLINVAATQVMHYRTGCSANFAIRSQIFYQLELVVVPLAGLLVEVILVVGKSGSEHWQGLGNFLQIVLERSTDYGLLHQRFYGTSERIH